MEQSFGEKYLSKLQQLDNKHFPSRHTSYKGFDEQEIIEVQEAQAVSCLPETYSQFLRVLGHERGIVFRIAAEGCGYFTELKTYKASLSHMLLVEHGNKLDLPTHSFVFYIDSWGGENSFFFPTDNCADDPPVYYYYEGITDFLMVSNHLSEWFIEQALYKKDGKFVGPVSWVRDHKKADLIELHPKLNNQEKPYDDVPF